AELVDRHRPQAHPGLEGDGHGLVDLAELLQGQGEREVVRALAAVLLGGRQAEQAHLAHLGDDVVGEGVLPVVLGGDGGDDLAGEFADRGREGRILLGQVGGQRCGHWAVPFCASAAAFSPSASSVVSAAVISASTWSTATWSPAATDPVAVPSIGAVSVCSLFIASTTSTGSPAVTSAPSAASTSSTLPGMGLRIWPSAAAAARRVRTGSAASIRHIPRRSPSHSAPSTPTAARSPVRTPSRVTVSRSPASAARAVTSGAGAVSPAVSVSSAPSPVSTAVHGPVRGSPVTVTAARRPVLRSCERTGAGAPRRQPVIAPNPPASPRAARAAPIRS